MRNRNWLLAGALALGLAAGTAGLAGATPLGEGAEPNNTIGQATPGGTAATTSLSGVMDASDADFFQFIIGAPISSFIVRPLTPLVGGNDLYDQFHLVIRDSTGAPIVSCNDCWFDQGSAEAFNLPAGTYFVSVVDGDHFEDGMGLNLGGYTVGVEIITSSSQPVPEAASLTLLGMGLAGLAWARRRRGCPSRRALPIPSGPL